ncbi:hypothetical protein ACFODZ_14270 [Marinicella sediminis]|uniref:Peptidase M11 gametolysin domain-containing protein n=1 Tax=Marinicella sediminis TaxID=1792834 RepID=A0ABV7JFF7_9GAMM|nr:hypothetical protein [Marinicella sediminis]
MKLLLWLVVCGFSVLHIKSALAEDGVLVVEYGETFESGSDIHMRYYLVNPEGNHRLLFSDEFMAQNPVHLWSGKRVRVQFKDQPGESGRWTQSIELLEGAQRGGITGAQPWVSILCKFNDVPAEPENFSFFQNMYANLPAGLDHYWREVSYENINVVGSLAVDWVDLPGTHTFYVPTPGSGTDANLNSLFDDCTDAADPFVDFSSGFVGINMMFNELLDCCAWGGGLGATLDGLFRSWRVTWNPPWSFANEGVIAHEMGHGFGLPHANNSDGDGNPYDSPWDVMSSATGRAVDDPVYGRLGKHINMQYKYRLGWVNDGDGFIADALTDTVIVIDQTALAATINHRFARLPLADGSHYMVEVRKQVGNYESNLAGEAVIIHHVVSGRSEPPWVIDQDVPPADFSDNEGVMWKVGETFNDPIDGYTVEVLSETTDGFEVRITGSDLIFADGFN